MKDFELKATEENVFDTLNKDKLERKEDIVYFIRLINLLKGGRSIALDGQWGSGKTFFVKQVKMILDAYNPHSIFEKEKRETIHNLFDSELGSIEEYSEIEPVLTLYYDAWKNDSGIDPLISLIYHMAIQVNQYDSFNQLKKDTKRSLIVDLVAEIIDCVQLPLPSPLKPGKLIKRLRSALESENPLNSVQKEKKLQLKIDEFLGEIIKERGNHLVVFIDELDRCRPDFAVNLLERVKHYFDNENVTFVFSINSIELTETIKQFYGSNFDGGRYLNRFFDFCVALPKGNIPNLLDSYKIDKNYYDIDTLLAAINGNNLELRETLRAIRTFSLIENNLHSMYKRMEWDDQQSIRFLYMNIVPVLIAVAVKDMQEYHHFVKGERLELFLHIMNQVKSPQYRYSILLDENESYESLEQKKIVKIDDKLTVLYKSLFSTTDEIKSIMIGKCAISLRTRRRILDIASLLSNFSNFQ